MKYPGFILSHLLPSKDEVCRFTDDLTRYLFHVTNHTDKFLKQHHIQHQILQQQLGALIQSVDSLARLDANSIVFEFFSELENVKDQLLDDAQLILEFDPAAASIDAFVDRHSDFTVRFRGNFGH